MNFIGNEGFVWFQGVVEDRDDPEKLGRCRVRCLGYHTDDKVDIPTDSLPWAYPMQPLTSAAMQGIGQTPLGPVEGTWVVGFFRDGREAQHPVIMGTLGGIPEELSKGKHPANIGFFDPKEKYPRIEKLNEPDTNRLGRGETGNMPDYPTYVGKYPGKFGSISIPPQAHNTIVQVKLADLDLGVSTPYGSWDEPPTPYAAKYPYNHVIESECGHIFEIDDTKGAERINRHHASGSFEEVHPDGTLVRKIKGDEINIVEGDKKEHIMGDYFMTVDKNLHINVGGDIIIHNLTGRYELISGIHHLTIAPRIDLNP